MPYDHYCYGSGWIRARPRHPFPLLLMQEMDKSQIEQMRQLSAGGAGNAPTEKDDDPALLKQIARQLVDDDAVLVIAELVAHSKSDGLRKYAAQVRSAY